MAAMAAGAAAEVARAVGAKVVVAKAVAAIAAVELTGVSLPQFCERESRQALQGFPHRGDGKIAGLCGTHRL